MCFDYISWICCIASKNENPRFAIFSWKCFQTANANFSKKCFLFCKIACSVILDLVLWFHESFAKNVETKFLQLLAKTNKSWIRLILLMAAMMSEQVNFTKVLLTKVDFFQNFHTTYVPISWNIFSRVNRCHFDNQQLPLPIWNYGWKCKS